MDNHHGEVPSHDYYHHQMHASQHPHAQQSHTPDGHHRRPDVPLGQAPVLGGGPVNVAPQASLFANASNGLSGDNQVKLADYWQRTITDIETREHDFKSHALPLARIKKVMKADEEVKMISAEAPILFAKGCEIFITELTMRAWIHAEENKRRTLQRSDIANAISRSDMFDFLIDIVPRDEFTGSANNEGPDATPVAGAAGGFMGMSLGHPGMPLHPAPHLQEAPRPDSGDGHYYNHSQLKHEESGGSNGHYVPHPQHAPHNLHPQHPQHPGAQQQQQHLRQPPPQQQQQQQQQQHPHHGMFDHNRFPMPPIGMPAMSHNNYMDHLGYGGGGGGGGYPHANGGPPQYGNPYGNPYGPPPGSNHNNNNNPSSSSSLPGIHARKDGGGPGDGEYGGR